MERGAFGGGGFVAGVFAGGMVLFGFGLVGGVFALFGRLEGGLLELLWVGG